MEKTTRRKRIPYGMMNFIDVREDNCYYVDKTRFIPMIEDANKYFFYIRPRRFGKSLTVSMLHHYYNILDADNFEKWYGDFTSDNTPLPNAILILLSIHGRPDQRIQHRLEYQYRLPVNMMLGSAKRTCAPCSNIIRMPDSSRSTRTSKQ